MSGPCWYWAQQSLESAPPVTKLSIWQDLELWITGQLCSLPLTKYFISKLPIKERISLQDKCFQDCLHNKMEIFKTFFKDIWIKNKTKNIRKKNIWNQKIVLYLFNITIRTVCCSAGTGCSPRCPWAGAGASPWCCRPPPGASAPPWPPSGSRWSPHASSSSRFSFVPD